MNHNKKRAGIIPYSILFLTAFLFMIPLVWLFLAAFNENASQALKIPERFSLSNFIEVLGSGKNRQGFKNSLVISVTQTVIVMVSSLLAAYPLSRYSLKSGQRITMFILFLTALPITAVMVPVYQLFLVFHLVDTIPGTILFMSASSLPYAVWMMKNFLDAVPVELEEAAWIDGASPMKSLLTVVLPLMVPGIFTVCIFTFMGSWGNFFVPFILLQSNEKVTAAVNLYRFFGERGNVMYNQLAAYSVIYMMPVFVLYFFSQNYMSRGFSMGGGTKG